MDNNQEIDKIGMREAMLMALDAKKHGDYAIGAVVMRDGVIIARSECRTYHQIDPSAHTEVTAIRNACNFLNDRYLVGCTLYSTHAPCAMCLGACVWASIDRVVYGSRQADIKAYSEEHGIYKDSKARLKWRATSIEPTELYKFLKLAHPNTELLPDFMRDECNELFYHD